MFLVFIPALLFSCQKKIGLAGTEDLGQRLVEQFRGQERAAISAGVSALTSRGGFQAELYLEPGATVLGLVYGYSLPGQSLFEFKLEGKSYLMLDFLNSRAYSNNQDWLADFSIESFPEAQDQMLIFLIQALFSLAGAIEPPTVFARSPTGLLIATARPGPDYAIKYFFAPGSARLEKMKVKKAGLEMTFKFAYPEDCWFPGRISLKNSTLKASLQTSELTCPETKRPQLNFAVPQGFRQSLVTGP